MTPQEFIRAIAPAAQASASRTRIPASFTVAEAALESAWGESLLARNGRNLFGIKADRSWKGATLTMNTREYLRGKWVIVPALWRKYEDWQGSIDDHAAFLIQNKRYADAFRFASGEDFAYAVAKAGYATDPGYAMKIVSIIRKHSLETLEALS